MREENVAPISLIAKLMTGSEAENAVLCQLLASHFEGHLYSELELEGPTDFIQELSEDTKHFDKLMGRWENRYYLQRSFAIEVQIFDLLKALLARHVKPLDMHVTRPLNEQQRQSVEKALTLPFCALTGGPGTGKTHTIVAILEAFLTQTDQEVVILAPTGKAASVLKKRIFSENETLFTPFFDRIEVTTLHRFLGLGPKKDPVWVKKSLGDKLCIVDEASMIDTDIWASLLKAAKEKARLLICGDPHQLPPVEIGSIFAEIVAAIKAFYPSHLAQLKISMRTESQAILSCAEAIKEGLLDERVVFKQEVNWEEVCSKLPSPFIGPISDEKVESLFAQNRAFRILTPLKRGAMGVSGINEKMMHLIKESMSEEMMWPLPIMVLKNEPALDLANGDVGFVIKQGTSSHLAEDEKVFFMIDGKLVSYPLYVLPSYEISYALSVHKSQGSEFDHVLLLLPPGSENFGKEIAYTGVTRAKKRCEIVSHVEVLEQVLSRTGLRRSALMRRFELHSS